MKQPKVGSALMREDIPAHFDTTFNPAIWRSGVVPVPDGLVLLVSLDKAYTNELPTARLFYWTSQNQTKRDSKRGRQLRDGRVFLFVRKRSKIKSKAAPFTYLGEASYVSGYGDQPIHITWELPPLPKEIYEAFRSEQGS